MPRKTLPQKDGEDPQQEFESIYKANQPLVYRFMLWRTKDDMLAEDLTSHVFEKAWRTRASFVGGSAKAWVFRIARTTLIDHWRKQKDVAVEDGFFEQVSSDEKTLDEKTDLLFTKERLQAAMRKLPDETRQVVEFRFIEGKSARQTGKALNLTEANVRIIQYRALQKIRKYLEP